MRNIFLQIGRHIFENRKYENYLLPQAFLLVPRSSGSGYWVNFLDASSGNLGFGHMPKRPYSMLCCRRGKSILSVYTLHRLWPI